MALYEVSRSDNGNIKPGEFVSGLVIAGGTAQARQAVAHLTGVAAKGKNLHAERVELTKTVEVVSVYFDEREPDEPETPAPLSVYEADEVAGFPDAETTLPDVPAPAPIRHNFL
jgi:hypothetical protein